MSFKNDAAAHNLVSRFPHIGTPTAKLLLLMIGDAVSDDQTLWMRQDQLARRAGISVASTARALRQWEELGLIHFAGFRRHALKTYTLPPVREGEVFRRRGAAHKTWEFAVTWDLQRNRFRWAGERPQP